MSSLSKIVITSGYYAPIHVGHLECFSRARQLGDILFVIVNNDRQVTLKGSRPFMSEQDRLQIVAALKDVDGAMISIDDDKTVCKTLEYLAGFYGRYPGQYELIFAKGGDRYAGEIPEGETCARLGIGIVDGLGAKIRASSEILKSIES